MPGISTNRQRPFVIDTESAFHRFQRRPSTGVPKKNKSPAKRRSGIIHVGHGNLSPLGSPVSTPDIKYVWPWSDTEQSKERKPIDEESSRLFWSVNAQQNQGKSTAKTSTPAEQSSKVQAKPDHQHTGEIVVMRRPASCDTIDVSKPLPKVIKPQSNEPKTATTSANSAQMDSVVQSLSKELQESGFTTKADTQLSSCASTLQVFENVHTGKLSNFMCDLYAHDQMTDMKVHVGSYGFNAHRVVLACFSPYFSNILLNSDKIDEYVLSKNITPTGFKKVLDYMYTKELTIEVENVAEILQAADVLQINELQDQCYAIFKRAKPAALLDMLETSHKQGVRYICENIILSKLSRVFYEVHKMDEVLQLCSQCFGLLLSRDDLVVESEYIVALTAVKWICYATDERMKVLEDVFSFIRFENMTSNELLQLGQEAKFLMENKSISEQILRVHWSRRSLELGMTEKSNMDSQQQRNYRAKKERPNKKEAQTESNNKEENVKCVQADKGKCEKVSANNNNSQYPRQSSAYIQNKLQEHCINWHMQNCEIDNKKLIRSEEKKEASVIKFIAVWKEVLSNAGNYGTAGKWFTIDTNIRNQKIIKMGDSAYLIGGTIGPVTEERVPRPTNQVVKIDLATSDFCDWFPMWEPRYSHSVTSVDNVIYVIGGMSLDGQCLSSIECLEHGHTKYGWKRECEMPSSRCGAAVATIQSKIYIAGGSQNPKQVDHILDSVLEYNTKVRQWSEIKCLPIPRFGAGMVSDGEGLYIIGGITSANNENVVSPDVDVWYGYQWMKLARLQKARFNCSVFVHNSRIVIFGGHSDMTSIKDTISESEVFNIHRKIWETGPVLNKSIGDNLHILF